MTNNNIQIDDKYIKVSKLGWVKFAKSRTVAGDIKRITISRKSSGQFYISINVETKAAKLSKANKNIGIDLGLTDFAIFSGGNKVSNPRNFKKLENKLAKEQRKLSRKKLKSQNWKKQKNQRC